tara:strand:- start:67 stop:525 length:459 start_codon:yes stop_codon:yes gene_type:complete
MLEINIRKANEKDRKILFDWFNDKESFKYKLKTKSKISFKEHSLWLKNILSDRNNLLSIIEVNKVLVGQIRLDYINIKNYEIDIYIAKAYRGMKIAKHVLYETEKKLSNGSIIISKVKKNNKISLNFFLARNFIIFRQDHIMWELKKKILRH